MFLVLLFQSQQLDHFLPLSQPRQTSLQPLLFAPPWPMGPEANKGARSCAPSLFCPSTTGTPWVGNCQPTQSASFRGKVPFPFAKASLSPGVPAAACAAPSHWVSARMPLPLLLHVFKTSFSYEIPSATDSQRDPKWLHFYGVNTQNSPPISTVGSRPRTGNIIRTLWHSRGQAWEPSYREPKSPRTEQLMGGRAA